MATKNELAVYLAGGRMFESQKSNAQTKFRIEKLKDNEWEINLKMTISSNDAGNSIFNFGDLNLPPGKEPKDIENLIFINGVKVQDPANPGTIIPTSIKPNSVKILIGGKPNNADKSSGGVEVHFVVEIGDGGKTEQGKTEQGNVE